MNHMDKLFELIGFICYYLEKKIIVTTFSVIHPPY